jgi:hypothetical protein
MKTSKQGITLPAIRSFFVLFTLLLTTQATLAQNLIKHYDDNTNVSIDYMIPSDEYVLSGNFSPATINGMDNKGPLGILSRILLRVTDADLNTVLLKTYCTAAEVNAINPKEGCKKLSVNFYCADAKQTQDGGFIICGSVRRDGETASCPGPTYWGAFLLKVDAAGVMQWYKRYDVGGAPASVVEDPNSGNFIMCGRLNPGFSGFGDGFIIGTDANGGLLWSDALQTPTASGSGTASSAYTEITPFMYNGEQLFALTGNCVLPYFNGGEGGVVITVIDANGAYYQSTVLTEDPFGRLGAGAGIHDAGDNTVVITGNSGFAWCSTNDGFHTTILRLDPLAQSVSFYKTYLGDQDITHGSSGHSIVKWGPEEGAPICVTGRNSIYGATYIEVDGGGNLMRYTPFSPDYANSGVGIVLNTNQGYPAFSGNVRNPSGGPDPSFAIRNNYGYDCHDNIEREITDLEYDFVASYHISINVNEVAEPIYDYDINPSEYDQCGQLKPAPSAVSEVAQVNTFTVAPNPAAAYLDVQFANAVSEKGNLKVYDITGRLVLSQDINAGTNITRINVETLTAGTYMLTIQNGNAPAQHTSFIKN